MKPQRILIADDDDKVLALLKTSLQKSGYETSLALNGAEALDLARKEQPDLILADVTMPEMDGFELCKIIRDDPAIGHIPFIFLTAKGELNDKVTGLSLGADDYISKPFHITEVTARIKAILQRVAIWAQQPSGSDESGLKGNLAQMQMAEVIQTLSMNQKTGGLKIVSESKKIGKIFFNNGDIVQASLGTIHGEEALFRLLVWEEGYFELDSSDQPDQPPIQTSTTSLLMQGFDQRDKFLKYKKAMPSFFDVLKVIETEQVKYAKPIAQKILTLIDGQRTIQDVIEKSSISYLLTVKLVYVMLKKGLIEAKARNLLLESGDEDFGQLAQELYK
ncbi:hypothetical protein CSA56_07225 [candidate division KSB3 bacterium]|uniref:Response regulatory domain-containing protein n=1 Tax=candidate division KSB3 bacterium TaxID=2044937 RepID=A0A2G6KG30_9BACT|nr:MAG: hypothetical protein CSA56_07225 [candidate division KSB3 bacterium]